MDINKAFKLLMAQEGTSLTAIKNDKGGLTKFGIAQASHPTLDVAKLTPQDAITIYAGEYWAPAKCSYLKTELQYIHFSCAVNCGVASAVRILQRTAQVPDDSLIGDVTIRASNNVTIQDYAIEWASHYTAIIQHNPTQQIFQQGWNNRIDTILKWYDQGSLA